jgi:hypothetical protein
LNNVFVEGVEDVRYFTYQTPEIQTIVEWMCGHGGHTDPISGPGGQAAALATLQWNWSTTFGNTDVLEALKFIYYDEWEQLCQENTLMVGRHAGAGGVNSPGDGLGADDGGACDQTGDAAGNTAGRINQHATSHINFIKAFLKLPVRMMRDGATFSTTLPAGTTAGQLMEPNTGEFGVLDDPYKYVNLHGAPQAYDSLSAGDSAALQHV